MTEKLNTMAELFGYNNLSGLLPLDIKPTATIGNDLISPISGHIRHVEAAKKSDPVVVRHIFSVHTAKRMHDNIRDFNYYMSIFIHSMLTEATHLVGDLSDRKITYHPQFFRCLEDDAGFEMRILIS